MGTPISVDNLGDKCDVCWGIDKPFGDTPTSSRISIFVSGVEKGPLWNSTMGEPFEGELTLIQSRFNPAFFSYVLGFFWASVEFLSHRTYVYVQLPSGYKTFVNTELNICPKLVLNTLTSAFKNGSAVITIPRIVL